MFNFKEIVSVSLILFSVIDILGSIPIVVTLRKKVGTIQSGKAAIVSGMIMVGFLFVGEQILRLFGLDVASFSLACTPGFPFDCRGGYHDYSYFAESSL